MRLMRMTAVLAAGLVLAPATLAGQKGFEGTVAYTMNNAGMAIDVTHYVKGNKLRQEMSVPQMGEIIALMEMGTGQMSMLMPAQKMYMTMDVGALARQAAQEEGGEEPDITLTGEKETIAGHECEHVTFSTNGGQFDMCAARDLGYYFMGGEGASGGMGRGGGPPAGMNPKVEAALRRHFGDGFFPLEVTVTQGGNVVTLVATSVEQKSLSDDLFVVPPGYTRMGGGD